MTPDPKHPSVQKYMAKVVAYRMIEGGFLNEYTVLMRARVPVYQALGII